MRWALLYCFLLITTCGAVSNGPSILLKIEDDHGHPVSARVRILNRQGEPVPVHSLDSQRLVPAHPNFPELGSIVSKQARLALPEGRSTLVIQRGPEYRERRVTVDAHPGEDIERTVALERWIDMAAKGWWSGDLHVHRDPRDLPSLMDASDLHFAPAITEWNVDVKPASWPSEEAVSEADQRVYSVDNSEDERHWGAALFIGVKSPMHLYARNAEYPPPSVTWGEARAQGGYIDLEKLIWWEAPVMAALLPPDSIGVAVNHFREDGISTRASLARPRDEKRYPGEQGFARYILDLYCYY